MQDPGTHIEYLYLKTLTRDSTFQFNFLFHFFSSANSMWISSSEASIAFLNLVIALSLVYYMLLIVLLLSSFSETKMSNEPNNMKTNYGMGFSIQSIIEENADLLKINPSNTGEHL